MKRCCYCRKEKSADSFCRRMRNPDGLHEACRECHAIRRKAYYWNNKEAQAAYGSEWKKNNPEKNREQAARWAKNNPEKTAAGKRAAYAKNPELYRAAHRAWKKANPVIVRSWNARRKAIRKSASPPWVDRKEITRVYEKAEELSVRFGDVFHVDHVVPLVSRLVCGLHVPANLQILVAEENHRKNNKHWPDMP